MHPKESRDVKLEKNICMVSIYHTSIGVVHNDRQHNSNSLEAACGLENGDNQG